MRKRVKKPKEKELKLYEGSAVLWGANSKMRKKVYKTPKEIHAELGLSAQLLKRYRLKGALKDVKWSFGHGKPYYNIDEVKKLFHK
jgi:hypothetical protein